MLVVPSEVGRVTGGGAVAERRPLPGRIPAAAPVSGAASSEPSVVTVEAFTQSDHKYLACTRDMTKRVKGNEMCHKIIRRFKANQEQACRRIGKKVEYLSRKDVFGGPRLRTKS